jgi:hypothetical protein
MPSSNPPVVDKPKHPYPLPVNLKELDIPWSKDNYSRNVRVDNLFKEGFVSGEDPRRPRPPKSPSKILTEL